MWFRPTRDSSGTYGWVIPGTRLALFRDFFTASLVAVASMEPRELPGNMDVNLFRRGELRPDRDVYSHAFDITMHGLAPSTATVTLLPPTPLHGAIRSMPSVATAVPTLLGLETCCTLIVTAPSFAVSSFPRPPPPPPRFPFPWWCVELRS